MNQRNLKQKMEINLKLADLKMNKKKIIPTNHGDIKQYKEPSLKSL